MFTLNLPFHSSGGNCLGLMIVIRTGETNCTGRKDMTGIIRSKNVHVCQIRALAL